MSDLNQLMRYLKREDLKEEELDAIIERMMYLIKRYDSNPGAAPICCFYTSKLNEVIKHKDYIILEEFKNYSRSENETVVGCSRGCLPLEEIKFYREKLCKECVEEAKKIINLKYGHRVLD